MVVDGLLVEDDDELDVCVELVLLEGFGVEDVFRGAEVDGRAWLVLRVAEGCCAVVECAVVGACVEDEEDDVLLAEDVEEEVDVLLGAV